MNFPRRAFIKSVGALSFLAAPKLLRAVPVQEKKLALYHIHTGEWLKEVVSFQGCINRDILPKLSHFMRDWRTNEIFPLDPLLLKLLLKLKESLPLSTHFDIICGYRSVATNEALRQQSKGVAANSLHCKGKAIDLSCARLSLKKIAMIAQKIGMGGVGYYPASGFIHVDIRSRPTAWGL